ncbi:MAG TPA: hypothetical protein VD838_04935 [Anaeromyxobacteraceae bacterium]|nr:hypothetical protein [Anaeromyxobacteraceae bacterium]
MTSPARSLAALAAALLVPAVAAAGDAAMRLEVGGGVDTNPLRLSEEGVDREGYVSAVAVGSFAGRASKLDLHGSLSLGARSYPNAPDANLLASRLDFGIGRKLSRKLRLDLSFAARDLSEKGGWRSETGGRAGLELTLRAGRSRIGFGGGFESVAPRDAPLHPFEWYGPTAAVWITTPSGHSQAVRVGVDYGRRHYPAWPETRDDDVVTASAEWLRRRPVLLGLGYSFSADFSNVAGGSHYRHRLTARAAVTLPGEVTVAMVGNLQRSEYPDEFTTDEPVLLTQQDAQNALELRVSRPLTNRIELALTAAAYDSELNAGDVPRVPYAREVIGIALSWRAPGRPEVALPPSPGD